jgi:hypothetical protein
MSALEHGFVLWLWKIHLELIYESNITGTPAIAS